VHGYLVDWTLNLQFNDGRDYLKGTNGEITKAHCYDIGNRYSFATYQIRGLGSLCFAMLKEPRGFAS